MKTDRSSKICAHLGCTVLVEGGEKNCPEHRKSWTTNKTKRKITGRKLQDARSLLFARDPLCAECKKRGLYRLAMIRDHVHPLAEGGADEGSNTQGLCVECHDAKSLDERTRAHAWRDEIRPEWLKASRGRLMMVFGPPGAGKSFYVAQRAAPGDAVIELDSIIAELSGCPLYCAREGWLPDALRIRNMRIAAVGMGQVAWLTLSSGVPADRAWWVDRLEPASVVMLYPGARLCIERIRADQRRPERAKARHIEAVLSYVA